jgi:hypothetical protein
MKQSPSWEAVSHSGGQLPTLFRTKYIHYGFDKESATRTNPEQVQSCPYPRCWIYEPNNAHFYKYKFPYIWFDTVEALIILCLVW